MAQLYSQYASGVQLAAGTIGGSVLGTSGINPLIDRLNSISTDDNLVTGSMVSGASTEFYGVTGKITGSPSAADDIATKNYVDANGGGTSSGTSLHIYASGVTVWNDINMNSTNARISGANWDIFCDDINNNQTTSDHFWTSNDEIHISGTYISGGNLKVYATNTGSSVGDTSYVSGATWLISGTDAVATGTAAEMSGTSLDIYADNIYGKTAVSGANVYAKTNIKGDNVYGDIVISGATIKGTTGSITNIQFGTGSINFVRILSYLRTIGDVEIEYADIFNYLQVGSRLKVPDLPEQVSGTGIGPQDGDIYYNTGSHHFYGFGGSWVQLDN